MLYWKIKKINRKYKNLVEKIEKRKLKIYWRRNMEKIRRMQQRLDLLER